MYTARLVGGAEAEVQQLHKLIPPPSLAGRRRLFATHKSKLGARRRFNAAKFEQCASVEADPHPAADACAFPPFGVMNIHVFNSAD